MSKILFCFLVFYSLFSLGQTKTGVVRYGEIQSMGMGAPVGADYNAILLFDHNNSLYITRQDSLEGGHINKMETYSFGNNGQKAYQTFVTNEVGFRYYNNPNKNTFTSRDIGFTYVKEPTPIIDWTIHQETKIIGGLKTKKATAQFRGRNYTAWFTPKIPLPFGPWKLQGLPGLILEAYDEEKEIFWYFKSINYPSDYGCLLTSIEKPENKEWVSREEYKKDLIASYKNSLIGGRMVSESMGINSSSKTKNDLSDSYIEAFSIDEEKK